MQDTPLIFKRGLARGHPLDPTDGYRRYCPEWRGIALQAAKKEPPKRFPSMIFNRNCSEPVLNSYASGDASHPESPDAT